MKYSVEKRVGGTNPDVLIVYAAKADDLQTALMKHTKEYDNIIRHIANMHRCIPDDMWDVAHKRIKANFENWLKSGMVCRVDQLRRVLRIVRNYRLGELFTLVHVPGVEARTQEICNPTPCGLYVLASLSKMDVLQVYKLIQARDAHYSTNTMCSDMNVLYPTLKRTVNLACVATVLQDVAAVFIHMCNITYNKFVGPRMQLPRVCRVCQKALTQKTSRVCVCRHVRYCGTDCQRADWLQQHKAECVTWH